ncbi:hypothetical protein GCM10010112_24930 [Actinoplanes lobatus]|uniref:Uncharacterized protein n=1 Tax=Actinoplanes lobatus TaxID=113568 RepID=A0A7W7HJ87_9ACTN|nr:hypothetical protein [Actinoplanes lobatus]GGN64579.1 hypothetical protein GCM10010112_24930 [Actinoplanes lobatus]GIE45959.1 hypothetical protein Alo02nite_88570 [Actinoplanes lobatus]
MRTAADPAPAILDAATRLGCAGPFPRIGVLGWRFPGRVFPHPARKPPFLPGRAYGGSGKPVHAYGGSGKLVKSGVSPVSW